MRVGIFIVVDGPEAIIHAPWKHHRIGASYYSRSAHCGATHLLARLDSHTPTPLVIMAEDPQKFPVALLFDLAPKHYLGLMPKLRVQERRRENDRDYLTLGLAYKPHPQVVLKVDYRNETNEAGTGQDQLSMAVGYLW